MRSATDDFTKLETLYRKARRTFYRDLFFFLGCIIVALVMRRILNYPPALSWVVFAVPAILFGGDVVRFIYRRYKLARFVGSRQRR